MNITRNVSVKLYVCCHMSRTTHPNKCFALKQVDVLATHCTGSIGYYLRLIIQTQLQLGRYNHACTNEVHCLANLRDLIPTLIGIHNYKQIKSCRFARKCVLFVHAWMYLPSWTCACMSRCK